MATRVPVNAGSESPPVTAAEAQTSARLLLSGVEAVACTRLFSVADDAPLHEVAALLSSALTRFLDGDRLAHGRPMGTAVDRRGGKPVSDDVGDVVWRVTATP